ncbi:hypothetical protein FOA22_12500 [Heyndrickxia oleronia]
MNEGDFESNIAYYCLHKFHKFPSEFLSLPRKERAVVIAAIQIKMKKEKEERNKNRTNNGRRK